MVALFREALEKGQPFVDSKRLQKILKLTPMVRFPNRTYRVRRFKRYYLLKLTPMVRFPNRTISHI